MTEPKATLPVTAAQLDALAQQLANWAERLKQVAETARTQPDETLGIYNWRSVPKGMQLLGGFVNRAEQSRSAAVLGNPIPVGQLKPRSAARKNMFEEAQEKIDKGEIKPRHITDVLKEVSESQSKRKKKS